MCRRYAFLSDSDFFLVSNTTHSRLFIMEECKSSTSVTSTSSIEPPYKRTKITHTSPIDDAEDDDVKASVRVINIDQLCTIMRLTLTQLSSSSTITMSIIQGSPGTFSGLRAVSLDPSKVCHAHHTLFTFCA